MQNNNIPTNLTLPFQVNLVDFVVSPRSDGWSLGLFHARLLGDIRKRDLGVMHLQEGKMAIELDMILAFEYLKVASGRSPLVRTPLSSFVQVLKVLAGYDIGGTTVRDLIRSHQEVSKLPRSKRVSRLNDKLSDPAYCMLNILIEMNYQIPSTWSGDFIPLSRIRLQSCSVLYLTSRTISAHRQRHIL